MPCNLRMYVTRFRISAHSLRIQTGRYARDRIARNERLCTLCNKFDIEDEYHFIPICPCYLDLRKKYIKKYYYQRPNMYKFVEMLRSENKNVLISLAAYIRSALSARNTFLNA